MGREQTVAKLKECIPAFVMLGDENRLKIMDLLYEHRELSVNELTARMHLSRPAVSHHLRLMLDAHLINVRQEGTVRHYSANFDCAVRLLDELLVLMKQQQVETGRLS